MSESAETDQRVIDARAVLKQAATFGCSVHAYRVRCSCLVDRALAILNSPPAPAKAEPIHTDDCESWGCTHCAVCGIGVLHGSRCHDHPATDPRWDGVVTPPGEPT